jgi:serine/threonine protein kinase
VVHRDLKPENICFTKLDQAYIKIIDMGAAGCLHDSPGGLTELCGTPLYAAPEVTPWYFVSDASSAARCPRYGKEVDYWSMGVALFVMLSGEAPFDQDQPVERLLADVCKGTLDFSAPRWAKARAARHIARRTDAMLAVARHIPRRTDATLAVCTKLLCHSIRPAPVLTP